MRTSRRFPNVTVQLRHLVVVARQAEIEQGEQRQIEQECAGRLPSQTGRARSTSAKIAYKCPIANEVQRMLAKKPPLTLASHPLLLRRITPLFPNNSGYCGRVLTPIVNPKHG